MIERGWVRAIVASRMGSASTSNAFKARKLETHNVAKSANIDYGSRLAVLLTHPGYVAARMNELQLQVGTEASVAEIMKSVRDINPHGNVRSIVWNGENIPR